MTKNKLDLAKAVEEIEAADARKAVGVTPDMLGSFIEPPPLPPAPPAVVAPYRPPVGPDQLKGHELRALVDFAMLLPLNLYASQVQPFKRGQIISDPLVCRQALAANMPVVKVGQETDAQYCSKCHRVFDIDAIKESVDLCVRPLSDLTFNYNQQLCRFGVNDIVTNPILAKWLLSQPHLPVVRVEVGKDYNHCACSHTYRLQTKDGKEL